MLHFPIPVFVGDLVTRVMICVTFLFISAAALPEVGRTPRFGHNEAPYLSCFGTSG